MKLALTLLLTLTFGLMVNGIGAGVAAIWTGELAMPDGPRCHPYGAQPQAASCQHDIAIARGEEK